MRLHAVHQNLKAHTWSTPAGSPALQSAYCACLQVANQLTQLTDAYATLEQQFNAMVTQAGQSATESASQLQQRDAELAAVKQHAETQIQELQAHIKQVEAALDQTQASLAGLAEQHESDQVAHTSAIDKAQAQINELEQAHAAARNTAADLAAELQAAQAQVASLTASSDQTIAQQEEQAAALSHQLHDAQAEAASVAQKLHEGAAEKAVVEQQLVQVVEQASALQETLVVEQGRLREALGSVVQLEHTMQQKEVEFIKVHQHDVEEIEALKNSLRASQETTAGLREELESLQVESMAINAGMNAVRNRGLVLMAPADMMAPHLRSWLSSCRHRNEQI